jgi:large subunit ribosomal protein L17e
MVKYSREPVNAAKGMILALNICFIRFLLACKAAGANIRVHFKNTFEVCAAIRGTRVRDAIKYLHAVIEKKRCVPFRRFNGGVGRTAQAKEFKHTQGRWPVKSAKVVIGLLENLVANAESKSLDVEKLVLTHVQCNEAQRGRRRTYRAHGRINAYMNTPCHVEMFAEEKEENIARPKATKTVKFTKASLSKKKLVAQN